jgi:hypothetical protein
VITFFFFFFFCRNGKEETRFAKKGTRMRRGKTGGEGEETCLAAASRTPPASRDDGVIATLDNMERRPYEHTREGSCRRRGTCNGCCGCKKKLLVSARRRVAMVDRGPRAATATAMARLPPSFSLSLSLSLFSASSPLSYVYYIRSTVYDGAGRQNPSLFQTPT